MKKNVFIAVLSLFYTLLFSAVPKDTRTEKYLPYGSGYFRISIVSDEVYKYQDSDLLVMYFYDIDYFDNSGKKIPPVGDFYNVDSKPVKIESITGSKNVYLSKRNSKYIGFTDYGEGKIQFAIGEKALEIKVNIIQLPLSISDSVDQMVLKMGFPDSESTDFYTINDELTVTTLYFYNKYPYLIIENESGTDELSLDLKKTGDRYPVVLSVPADFFDKLGE